MICLPNKYNNNLILRLSQQKESNLPSVMNKRLKQVRETTKLSQKAFAQELGIAQSVIAEIETGKNEPSRNLMIRLKKCYKVSIDWLLTGEGEMFKKKDIKDIIDKENLDNVSQKILIMLEGMTEEERREVLRNVEDKKLLKELKEEFLKKKAG